MKLNTALVIVLFVFLAACQADVCPPESVGHVSDASTFPALDTEAINSASTMVQIGSNEIEVDRVIHGPICNDVWEGVIYVSCDVQVEEWNEDDGPFFFDNCDLTVEPGTVVYVASHNNTAYYKGCAVCHTRAGSE
jgi:hypothetical protein